VPYVMVDPRSNAVAGYYTLTNYKVNAGELPTEITRRIPYEDVPATLIGRLAVDLNYQGQGLGGYCYWMRYIVAWRIALKWHL
jgi:predicted N-acetyltransferase YhbS